MTDLAPYIERLAEYLINEFHRRGFSEVGWDLADEPLKANGRKVALGIIMGEIK